MTANNFQAESFKDFAEVLASYLSLGSSAMFMAFEACEVITSSTHSLPDVFEMAHIVDWGAPTPGMAVLRAWHDYRVFYRKCITVRN